MESLDKTSFAVPFKALASRPTGCPLLVIDSSCDVGVATGGILNPAKGGGIETELGTQEEVDPVEVFCSVFFETALNGGTGIVIGLCALQLPPCSTGITTMLDRSKEDVFVAGGAVAGGEVGIRSFFPRN